MPIRRTYGPDARLLGAAAFQVGAAEREAELADQMAQQQAQAERREWQLALLEQQRAWKVDDAEMARRQKMGDAERAFARQVQLEGVKAYFRGLKGGDKQREAIDFINFLTRDNLEKVYGITDKSDPNRRIRSQIEAFRKKISESPRWAEHFVSVIQKLLEEGRSGDLSEDEKRVIAEREAAETERKVGEKEEKAEAQKQHDKKVKVLDAEAKDVDAAVKQVQGALARMKKARAIWHKYKRTGEGEKPSQEEIDFADAEILDAYEDAQTALMEYGIELPDAGAKPSGDKEIRDVKGVLKDLLRIASQRRRRARWELMRGPRAATETGAPPSEPGPATQTPDELAPQPATQPAGEALKGARAAPKRVTLEIAREYLRKAGGDEELCAEMLRADGYSDE